MIKRPIQRLLASNNQWRGSILNEGKIEALIYFIVYNINILYFNECKCVIALCIPFDQVLVIGDSPFMIWITLQRLKSLQEGQTFQLKINYWNGVIYLETSSCIVTKGYNTANSLSTNSKPFKIVM